MSWSLGGGLWTPCHGDLTQLVNSRLCVLILSLLAATHLLLVTVYFPAPISCFCPAYMEGSQCVHLTQKCVANPESIYEKTYNLAYEDVGYLSVSNYYNHVVPILLVQAILFYMPSIVWREFARKVGILPEELALSAVEARHTNNATDRESSVRLLAKHVQSFCTRQLRRRHVSYAFWWFHGNKLVLVQIVSKLLYGANVIGQFFLLDAFLGMPFHDYGWQLLGRVSPWFHTKALIDSIWIVEDEVSPNTTIDNSDTFSVEEEYLANLNETYVVKFHREVMCSTVMMFIGNIHRYTMECVLPINQLNELIFSIVWFLLLIALIVTMTSIIHAVYRFVFFACHRMSIRERLQDQAVLDSLDPREGDTIREVITFEKDFLQRDGLFLIDYIESAAGDVITDDVIKYLWEFYKENSAVWMDIARPVTYAEEVDDRLVAWRELIEQGTMTPTSVQLELDTQEPLCSGPGAPPLYEHLTAEKS